MTSMNLLSSAQAAVHERLAAPASAPTWRVALVASCTVAVVAAIVLGRPDAHLVADAELALLLRGMAALKAAMVAAALVLVLWRLGRPVARRNALVYVIGTAALSAATALIWQLASIPAAALVFHLAGLALMLAAYRDDAVSPRAVWRARHRAAEPAVEPPAARRAEAPAPEHRALEQA
jgi:hypothetical protein